MTRLLSGMPEGQSVTDHQLKVPTSNERESLEKGRWRPMLGMWPRITSLILLMPILCSAVLTQRDNGPQPPCGLDASPPYPALDDPPTTKFWERSDLGRDWPPPACTGWTTRGFATLVVTVGRFRNSSRV